MIDLQNQQSSMSFKDSDSNIDRSSQISLVTDKDMTVREPAGASSTIIVQAGF
jgi:hypothetical protein